ncbi:MAG: 50S ribosomal protein L9 [Bdellovibrionota bacterium]
MEIILKEDFPQLGFVGDTVKVKSGYARNFLIPRGLAVVANSAQANVIKHEMQAINAKKARLKELAEEKKGKIGELSLEYKLKAGEDGKVFGSITSQNIEESMKKEGVQVERKQIKLSEPLKDGGEFEIPVKLHADVVANLKVLVEIEKYQRPTRKKVDKKARHQKQDKKVASKEKVASMVQSEVALETIDKTDSVATDE